MKIIFSHSYHKEIKFSGYLNKTFYFSDIWYDNMSLIQTKRECQARPLKKTYDTLQEVPKGVPKSTVAHKYEAPNNTLSIWIKKQRQNNAILWRMS